MFTKVQATIYNGCIGDYSYRLILQGHQYELLQEEVGYEEGGDAESGPRMHTYTKGYTLISCGCGGPNDTTERGIFDFITIELEYYLMEEDELD